MEGRSSLLSENDEEISQHGGQRENRIHDSCDVCCIHWEVTGAVKVRV